MHLCSLVRHRVLAGWLLIDDIDIGIGCIGVDIDRGKERSKWANIVAN